ncbi:EAL domain-containing protein [Pseudoroseomonas globiformis]|uniref:EAL domain-containing protein n=1 Tax=Teichococcus globiformis TaxID=2307229 RepID=A0ABV7FYD6_9PROT
MSNRPNACPGCQQEQFAYPFTMAFQPIVDLRENRIDAHEALVRGPAGESAAAVLAQLDAQNLYAFDQACRVKAIELAARLKMDNRLNINFLPNAVYQPKACIRQTLSAAARTGFPLDRLTFEFTEGEQISDERHLLSIIEEYRRHGFKIALDDFATGYSGLARLADLRPDIIKLDRALVKDCDTDKMRLSIITSMVALGTDVGIKVVAEGIERSEEVDALRAVGVRFMQGFYFARPLFEGLVGVDTIRWPAG